MLPAKTGLILQGFILLLAGCTGALQQDKSTTSPLKPVESRAHPTHDGLKIGIALPLKGEHKALGESLQKTAEWAYFKGLKAQNITLLFQNTNGTAAGAKAAVEKLVNQNIDALIGPVFAQETTAIQALVKAKKLPVFSLSNTPTSAGGSIFIMGANPLESVKEGLRYAASQGVKTFVALLPQSPYGTQLSQALPAVASQAGLIMRGIHMYSSENPYDYKGLSFEGVDALLLPEGLPNSLKILAALFHQGIDLSSLRVIGSSLWEGMTPYPDRSWFAAPDLQKANSFFNDYEDLYGARPPKLALILYDTLFLAAALKQHYPHDSFALKHILQPHGFMGIQGPFKFNKEQYVERSLNVYESTQGRLQQVKLAATAS